MTATHSRCSNTSRFCTFVLLAVGVASTTGCASRTAPFDSLDQAQVTILRLGPAQAQQPVPQAGGMMIPGIPPEIQALGQQALQAAQQGGLIPPGLIPGLPAGGQTPGMAPQQPMFRNQWAITDQKPVMDPDLNDMLLDLFGDADSFNDQRGNCFFPGMAVSFQSPNFAEPVDVVVSFSCNQAVGYGFQWPHPQSGFTQDTHAELRSVYERLFGPVPQGA